MKFPGLSGAEPWLVACAVGALTWARELPPSTMGLGSLLAVGALALLLQGFVRDVAHLARMRSRPVSVPAEEARCICLESALGLPVVLAGVAVVAVGLDRPVAMPPWSWPAGAAIVWGAGFLMRDVVLTWSPWGFRRVADHGAILVQWRRRRR